SDDSHLADLARPSGGTRRVLLGALLDELERVNRGLRLRPGEEVADCLLLATVALCDRPVARALDQAERDIRGGSGAVDGVVDSGPGTAEDRLRVGPVGLSALGGQSGELAHERERLADELRGLEQPIGD